MDIYLIRHGQTDGNVAKRHQHADTPLNEVGKQEAEKLTDKLLALGITHLVSSTQMRALMTAEVASIATGLIPATSSSFAELKRPQYLIGEYRTGLKMIAYMSLWYLGYRPASYHDGETYTELRTRVGEAKALLATYPKDARVAVFSHAGFITFFLFHLNYSKKLPWWRACFALGKMIVMRNTAIHHVTFDGQHWRTR